MSANETNELFPRAISSGKLDRRLGRILIVDDDADVCALYGFECAGVGFDVQSVHSKADALTVLKNVDFETVLLDLQLGDGNGFEILSFVLSQFPRTKVWVMSAHGTIDLAVRAMKMGASGFFQKDGSAKQSATDIKASVLVSSNSHRLEIVNETQNYGLIGTGMGMRRVLHAINQMKNVDSTILICGESGTGKELIARALHQLSPRANQPFIAINCGAIPENLLESELFGHSRGAFTDAKADRQGIFEICSKGTILLDEIGEMPPILQVKLLRVLQEKEVRRLGSSQCVKVNTRVLAATNKNLEAEVKAGRFREDLYYRLSVLRIESPPLRERKEDIPLLIAHLVQRFNERFGKNIKLPYPELMAHLIAYDWPGNVRELQNAIERGIVLSEGDSLSLDQIFLSAQAESSNSAIVSNVNEAGEFSWKPISLDSVLEECEKKYLTSLIRHTGGNISEAARISKQHRPRLYRLLKKLNIDVTDYKGQQ